MALNESATFNHKAFAVIISGITGIVAQVVLLRELLVSFQGNELSLGIILSNWLLFEALGSYLAGKWPLAIKTREISFALIQVLLIAGLIVGIYIARSAREIMGLPPGQGLGVDAMFLVSIVALLPVSLPHGASFTFASLVLSKKADALGKCYVYENLGTMIGGVLATLALVPFFNSFGIASALLFLSIVAAICVLWDTLFQKNNLRGNLRISLGLVVIGLMLLIFNNSSLHNHSLSIQWNEQNLVSHKNSVYGNIAVVEQGGEYTFFVDGQPVITTPTPDIIRLEELVHFTMLSHPNPKNVVVLTGGAGGKINEILKHPSVTSVDYVELDPLLPSKIKQFSTWLTHYELNHPKVQLHYDDGRYYIQQSGNFYDVCIVGISNPTDLQTNRFFTVEFYKSVKNRLNHGGILAISLPSLPRAQLLVEGLAAINKQTYATLNAVFDYVRVFPGEGYNIFLASQSDYILRSNSESMSQKIKARDIDVVLLYEPYIEYRTLPWWSENFYTSIQGWQYADKNRDFEPIMVFESMMYFGAMFTPNVALLLDWLRKYGLYLFASLVFVSLIVAYVFKRRGDVPLSIATTGFAGMLLDLVIIFAFQAFFGYVFYWIGILVSVFMAGAAIAAHKITSMLPTLRSPVKFFLKTDIAVMAMCLILPLILILLHTYALNFIPAFLIKGVFVVLSFGCGTLVGAQYPVACHIMRMQGKDSGRTTGLIYGLDLLGGWLGGVIGGLFLLPLLGIFESCLILSGLKGCTVVILILSRRKNV